MDLRQTPEWGNYLQTLGWESVYDGDLAIRVRRLGPVAIVKVQRFPVLDEEVVKEIVRVGKKYHAFYTKLEPLSLLTIDQLSLLKKYRFKADQWPLSVTKTLVVDLTKSLEEILAKFSKDGRYCLRQAEKVGATLVVARNPVAVRAGTRPAPTHLENFYKLFKETSRRGHFWVPSLKEMKDKVQSFGSNVYLFMAYKEDKAVAGAMVFKVGNTAYYLHAGSNQESQKLEAPYLLMWEVIKKAKELGCTKLDLEGIYDPRFKAATKNWQGFTTFKHKFGGEEVTFPGSFSRYL